MTDKPNEPPSTHDPRVSRLSRRADPPTAGPGCTCSARRKNGTGPLLARQGSAASAVPLPPGSARPAPAPRPAAVIVFDAMARVVAENE